MPQLIEKFDYKLEDLSIKDIDESSTQLYLSPVYSLYQIALSKCPKGELDEQILICNLVYVMDDWIIDSLEEFKDERDGVVSSSELVQHLSTITGIQLNELEREVVGAVGVTTYNDGYLKGVQIRSTFIDENHRGNKLSEKAYSYIASKFDLVLSDSRQTIHAATLWQNALPRAAVVTAYDSVEKKQLEVINPHKELNGRYWSITPMDKSKKDTYINAKERYMFGSSIDTIDCKIHIILTMKCKK